MFSENTNVKGKSDRQMHHLLMKSQTMAKDQDETNCHRPPMHLYPILTEVLTGTREVKVQALNQTEDAIKIEKKLMILS